MTTEPERTETQGGEGGAELPGRLQEARLRFEQWRQTRSKAGPIPEELWAEAASCAAEHGCYRTARVLGIDSTKLKGQMAPAKKKGRKKRASRRSPTFVEVTPPRAVSSSECVLEVESRSGTRLRIQLKDTPLAEVAEFARSLARGET
jgi:hypothetical protein